jgi:protein-disulfide isomerase
MDAVLGRSSGQPAAGQAKLTDEEFSKVTGAEFPTRGKAGAPITIALYTDFQCPYCKQQSQILADMRDDVRVVFHHMPLNSHAWARPAAEMAGCVFRQSNDAFWALFDDFYQGQGLVTVDTVCQFVRKFIRSRKDIDEKTFEACVADNRSAAQVDQDIEFARRNGFAGSTPTMIVNGVRTQGVLPAERIKSIAQAQRQIEEAVTR